MKYTNIKKLLIKFMGGGLINFPTRFLRWIKIDGDSEGDDGGEDSSDSDVFFVPATIQPKYFFGNSPETTEIKDYTSDIEYAMFLYNKEDMISLGIDETGLNSLTQVTPEEAFMDTESRHPTKGLNIDKEVFKNTIILSEVRQGNEFDSGTVKIYNVNTDKNYILYKISDDIFLILEYQLGVD